MPAAPGRTSSPSPGPSNVSFPTPPSTSGSILPANTGWRNGRLVEWPDEMTWPWKWRSVLDFPEKPSLVNPTHVSICLEFCVQIKDTLLFSTGVPPPDLTQSTASPWCLGNRQDFGGRRDPGTPRARLVCLGKRKELLKHQGV